VSEILVRSQSEILESRSRIFYLRLCNPGFHSDKGVEKINKKKIIEIYCIANATFIEAANVVVTAATTAAKRTSNKYFDHDIISLKSFIDLFSMLTIVPQLDRILKSVAILFASYMEQLLTKMR